MKYFKVPDANLEVSNVVMGCMHLTELSKADARTLIETALEQGVNFFDHADMYDCGKCEVLFADAIEMNDDKRERMILQSKCGIVKCDGDGAYYDFSRSHILESVKGSLKRLKTDYLDVLLLHRPDALMEPDEIAEAFEYLHSQGMVRYFGVSNQNPMQMQLIQKSVKQKLVFNQLQLSIVHTPLIDAGMSVNMKLDQSIDRDGNILEYCRLNDVTVQAWSPFQKGFFEGPFLGDMENYAQLNQVIDRLAEKYSVKNTAIAVAWITRHPANMQVITGTTKPGRLADCCSGSQVPLTKQEWYELYKAAGNMIP
ncbi:MAG: aldo/keto reductase [Christensenella sp.]|uniref:aldo/keto reductase n=1 Tax=Christensenella sp. TaxID=1935934 RepID=UPI002B200A21|nr:aldo/keto reductase [Christensenella sp.]MEA5004226.1 aldo/keto reductase [Christensenella sp.]